MPDTPEQKYYDRLIDTSDERLTRAELKVLIHWFGRKEEIMNLTIFGGAVVPDSNQIYEIKKCPVSVFDELRRLLRARKARDNAEKTKVGDVATVLPYCYNNKNAHHRNTTTPPDIIMHARSVVKKVTFDTHVKVRVINQY